MATTSSTPEAAALLLLPYLFIIALLQPVTARPLHAPPACAETGVQPVALSKPLDFCGGEIGDFTCCDGAKDTALRAAFVQALSKEHTHDHDAASSCAALLKNRLCAAVCFPAARIPADNSIPASCATLAPALLSSSTKHLSGSPDPALPSRSICFEKVAAANYSGLIVAPDGSGRAVVWNQQGKVRFASMPAVAGLQMSDSPFIDLSHLACYDEVRGLRGLVGMASHPRMDGRFFVSYTTTKSDGSDCGHAAEASATASCALLVVAELSPRERAFEATTVFSMELPATQAGFSLLDLGGQIFSQPNDPYLYLITGHGVLADGFSSSNKSHSWVGKILRLYVDHDVPGTDVEVFFSGLNIPRGCSLDYSGSLYCANIDETQRELVYLISDKKAANENPSSATSVIVLDLQHPTVGMAPSIVWGLRYQGSADASLSGRYLYAYDSAFWSVAVESPPSSTRYYTPTRMLAACSKTTPMPCQDSPIVVSFAEDQNKEGVILATDGVYRIVASILCTDSPLAPASRRSSVNPVAAVLGSVLGVMGTALCLAFVICKKILEEDGKCAPCLNIECFRDCSCRDNTCICCCSLLA